MRKISEETILPQTGTTLREARTYLTGLHFAKESLTDSERELLYVAEGLLRLADPGSYGIELGGADCD